LVQIGLMAAKEGAVSRRLLSRRSARLSCSLRRATCPGFGEGLFFQGLQSLFATSRNALCGLGGGRAYARCTQGVAYLRRQPYQHYV